MENSSNLKFSTKLAAYIKQGWIPEKLEKFIEGFYEGYVDALIEKGKEVATHEHILLVFLDLIKEQIKSPSAFAPYHRRVRTPFDYYRFGNDFIRPLIDFSHSSVSGGTHLAEIAECLKNKENVILLANHQTEADPQIISLLLEKKYPLLGEEMIFVAGERVVTDPLAVPFSLGRDLLCIYSKRYIDHPPEEKSNKQLHNKRTMQLMSELLTEGGKCIYVAPSGGRDRKNAQGAIEIAPFDPQSIEMFYLMAKRAEKPTRFYPLALSTYDLLPPPAEVQVELGEKRIIKLADIHIAFGPQIDMENYPGSDLEDKHLRRQARAEYIWKLVKEDYEKITS